MCSWEWHKDNRIKSYSLYFIAFFRMITGLIIHNVSDMKLKHNDSKPDPDSIVATDYKREIILLFFVIHFSFFLSPSSAENTYSFLDHPNVLFVGKGETAFLYLNKIEGVDVYKWSCDDETIVYRQSSYNSSKTVSADYVGKQVGSTVVYCTAKYDDGQSVTISFPITVVDAIGVCGPNASFRLTKADGCLIISGTGRIYDLYDNEAPNIYRSPWEIYQKDIKNVIIEEGITCIGNGVFNGCDDLESVYIPSTVNSFTNNPVIDTPPFYACTSLKCIHVSKDNLKYKDVDGVLYSKDGKCIIYYPPNKEGTTYLIPSYVTSIEKDAFGWNVHLVELNIPSNVIDVGESAFSCSQSLEIIRFNEGTKTIGNYILQECPKLRKVFLPESLESLGHHAFQYSHYIESITALSNTATYGDYPFGEAFDHVPEGRICKVYCDKYCGLWYGKSTTISKYRRVERYDVNLYPMVMENPDVITPSSLISIGDYSFSGISAKTILLSESVKEIGSNAFSNCPNLIQIYIPSSVETISEDAFDSNAELYVFCKRGSKAEIFANIHSNCSLVYID